MKKLLAVLLFMLPALCAMGQAGTPGEVALIIRRGDPVSCRYTLSARGTMPVKESGTALLCGGKYRISGPALDTFSDGVTVWTVDRAAREVYISGAGESLASRLEEYLGFVSDFNYDGRNLSCTLRSDDGSVDLDFSATDISFTSPPEDGAFVFDVSSLDSSWVVTDLR